MRPALTAAGALPLVLLWGVPLALGLAGALASLTDGAAWRALLQHPQLWPALALSLWTGTAAAALSLMLALWITPKLLAQGPHAAPAWMLALPHLSFAIGFGFLIMPAGLIMRLIAPFAGWDAPPQIVTNHDPLGVSLIAVLALKETPFLLWAAAMVLSRPGVRRGLAQQSSAALSLGHGRLSLWVRVIYPQLLRRLSWPIAIVWVYGATVIDVAVAIGPTQPPTLAPVIWADLNDADAAMNARGRTGALFLTGALAAAGMTMALVYRAFHGTWRRVLTRGPSPRQWRLRGGAAAFGGLATIYVGVLAILLGMLIAGPWPFPSLLPASANAQVALHFLRAPAPLVTSVAIAVPCAAAALLLAVLWFECVAERFDAWLAAAAMLALAAPPVLIASGQYAVFLPLRLTGTYAGLLLAHLTPVLAYVVIVLQGPYRAFDPRYLSAAAALGAGPLRRWTKVKGPLLSPAMTAAAATGFAVAIGQFVPAQLIAAGRFSTLPMEAVTLTSGGSRPLLALYAFALALLPLLAFGIAAKAAKPRWEAG